jgi:hypothetical protein
VRRGWIGITTGSGSDGLFAQSGELSGFKNLSKKQAAKLNSEIRALRMSLDLSDEADYALGRLPDGRMAAVVFRHDVFNFAVIAKIWKESNRRIRPERPELPVRVLGAVTPLDDKSALTRIRRLVQGLAWEDLPSPPFEPKGRRAGKRKLSTSTITRIRRAQSRG